MVYAYDASCGSISGNGRNRNEDNFYFNKRHLPESNMGLKNPIKCNGTTEEQTIFAVFDGIGGELKGEEASYVASEIFAKEAKKLDELVISGKEFLVRACDSANAAINRLTKEKQISSMGTTVAALYFSQDEVVSCNVGDSKVFRIRDKQMIQISEDHTDEKIMSVVGIKKRPVLLQYIGVPDDYMSLEPYVSKGDIREEDIYVICSDGVTDFVDLDFMYEILNKNSADESVRKILAEVDKSDISDNATLIVVKFA